MTPGTKLAREIAEQTMIARSGTRTLASKPVEQQEVDPCSTVPG
jgi:hypothetical protein